VAVLSDSEPQEPHAMAAAVINIQPIERASDAMVHLRDNKTAKLLAE
jgi:hypothetical protein